MLKGIGLALALGLASSGTWADHHRKGDGEGRWEKMAKDLNLSQDQQKRIKEIKEGHKASLEQKHQASKAAMEEFQSAMKGGDKNEVLGKFDAAHAARTAAKRERLSMMLEMREVLTPDQREKFGDLKKERREKWGGKRGGRGQGKRRP